MSVLPEQEYLLKGFIVYILNKPTQYSLTTLKNPAQAQDTFHEAVLHIDILMAHENLEG